jgi:Mrp family chromosome partitioning ATPase
MAKRKLLQFKPKRQPATPDELGGLMDGGIAILDVEGKRIHITPSKVAASLRYFLARVQLHDADGLPSRLAITSALVGEGVTYISRSLAAVLAYDTEVTVALVDLSWRRPAPGAEGAPPGLADVIERGTPLDDVIIVTSNPRLKLVPPGQVPVARRPALASGHDLADALEELDKRFDHLLLDLPPVLATSEAMNLSQFADAYALVVRQGVTSEAQVEAALEEMQGGEVLGVILNRFDSSIPKRIRRLVGT